MPTMCLLLTEAPKFGARVLSPLYKPIAYSQHIPDRNPENMVSPNFKLNFSVMQCHMPDTLPKPGQLRQVASCRVW